MIIEVGKAAKTRDGRMAYDITICRDGLYAGLVEGNQWHWWADGTCCTVGCGGSMHLDLISPWEDSKTEDFRFTNQDERLLASALNASSEHLYEIKSESKMDVKVGDRVLVECRVVQVVPHDAAAENCSIRVATLSGGIWIHRSEIKSVEPAPPGVGDTVAWDDDSRQWRVVAIDADEMWVKTGIRNEIGDVVRTDAPGFRVLKRAEPK